MSEPSINSLQNTAFETTRIKRRTLLTLAFVLIALGIWTALVPMQSAVITTGFVRAENANKPVQHLQGGKLSQVYVKPGDRIEAGTPLAQLNVDQEKSALKALLNEYLTIRTQLDLAESELKGEARPAYSDKTLVLARRLEKMMPLKLAASNYVERMATIQKQMELLTARRHQLLNNQSASETQLNAFDAQHQIISGQLDSLSSLAEQQLVSKVTVDETRQRLIQIASARSSQQSLIEEKSSQLEQLSLEKDVYIAELRQQASQRRTNAASAMPNLESRIERLRQKVTDATIISKYPGIVTNLRHRSAGGTLAPGEALMQIVPSQESMIVEVRLNTSDIEQVYPGQPGRIRLSAFNVRSTALIDGEVVGISADRHQDQDGHFYQVEMRISDEALGEHPTLHLSSGMPVEAFLITEERSVLAYLWAPLARGLNRSLREA